MKHNLLLLIVVTMLATACKRDYTGTALYQPVDGSQAYLKIVHAAPNFRQVFGTRDSFNVYANGQKINASFLTYNSVYPFAVNATTNSITGTYASINPGVQEIKLSVPGVTGLDSFKIFSFSKTLEAGKYYSLVITDSLKSAKDSTQIFVQDNVALNVTGNLNFRFIHAALNDTAGKTVDVFSYARGTTILTGIKPATSTSFFLVGYNPQTFIDTLYVTRSLASGVPAATPLSARIVLAKIATNAVNVGSGSIDQRAFTLYYKGDATTAAGTKGRALGIYLNK